MTNIEQSVGRILRQKHDFAPIVVDIIDTHDNFQRQWAKRKAFYKKQNYKIIQTNSSIYDTDASKWKIIYEPTKSKNVVKTSETKKEKLKCSSRSSSDRSIADDTESEEEIEEIEEEETKKVSGVCLLKFKK
jgi:hypothetical protein